MKRMKRWQLLVLTGLLFVSVFSIAILKSTSTLTSTKAADTKPRDPLLQPYASTSIWNTPVGNGAVYMQANETGPITVQNVIPDVTYLVQTKSTDPKVPLYQPGWTGNRCASTTPVGFGPIYMPNDFTIPDNSSAGFTPNAPAAIVQPDGKSMIQLAPFARCNAGGPAYGWWAGGWGSTQDIKGDGLVGAHWGAGLSSIGGMLRKGELQGNDPIPHALAIEFWLKKYGYYSASNPTKGHVWPASLEDAYAPGPGGYGSDEPALSHPNPYLRSGTLFAVPPAVTKDGLNLQTDAAKKIFDALQNYGGYHVDDSGWDAINIGIEKGVDDEFKKIYGYDFGQGAFGDDIKKIVQQLQIIKNNGPDSIGGGGDTRRAPWAAAFADGTGGPPAGAPTPAPTQQPTVEPTGQPTQQPTAVPTTQPTAVPTAQPTAVPTAQPTPVTGNTLPVNNIGTSSDGKSSTADYDGVGNTYSQQALEKAGIAPGKTITSNGVTFTWPTSEAGKADNYKIDSFVSFRKGVDIGNSVLPGDKNNGLQPVTVKVSPVSGATMLAFLGSATHGPSKGKILITYSDGSHKIVDIGFDDWTRNGGQTLKSTFNNKIAATMPYRNSSSNASRKETVNTYVFSVEVPLTPGKTIVSVTLPLVDSHGSMHFFGVGTK